MITASVVIPTFNRRDLLPRAIRSAIGQNGTEIAVEAVVVDDGSTDGTSRLAGQFPEAVRWCALDCNQGRNRARNIGLLSATGTFAKFLDSDDYLEPGSLLREARVAVEQTADIVASGFRVASLDGQIIGEHPVPSFANGIDSILAGEAVATAAALYRRKYIASVAWDESLSKLDDWDFFVRAVLHGGRLAICQGCSYTWITHPGQGVRSATVLQNAREHHAILAKIEALLLSRGQLTEARKKRLAQYYYKELRVLCLHDRDAFERAARHIRTLDPSFLPRDEERQPAMRLAARIVGFRLAVLMHTSIKRIVKGAPLSVRDRRDSGAEADKNTC